MKTKLFAAWLAIPFAAAVALDSGAAVRMGACISPAWVVSALAWLELYRRHEENKRQRRFNKCLQYRNRKAG